MEYDGSPEGQKMLKRNVFSKGLLLTTALLFSLILGSIPKPASAVSLCARVKHNGKIRDGTVVRLRRACRRHEVALPIRIEKNLVLVSGANLQVVDGSGDTEGPVNGLGNIIVGYNETDVYSPAQFGSHNLVVGPEHAYNSYGGLVAGKANSVSGPYASITGGMENFAPGEASSVTGGVRNQATGRFSSVSGGEQNHAGGVSSCAVGGKKNHAHGYASAILSGYENVTAGGWSAISGGQENYAQGNYSTVGGGRDRSAPGSSSWRAGSLLQNR